MTQTLSKNFMKLLHKELSKIQGGQASSLFSLRSMIFGTLFYAILLVNEQFNIFDVPILSFGYMLKFNSL